MVIVALLIVAPCAGCGSGEELSKQLDTLASWTATAQLAVQEHRAGAITTIYATQLDAAATQALTETQQSLARTAHDANDSRRAGAALDSLERAIHLLHAETRR